MYAQQIYTSEVYKSTPSNKWASELAAWKEAMREVGHNVKCCPVASPMPSGHVMFLKSTKRRPSQYKLLTEEEAKAILASRSIPVA